MFNFKEFKKFLSEKCGDEKKYGEGGYDKDIFNWFLKPKEVKNEYADRSKKQWIKFAQLEIKEYEKFIKFLENN